MPHPAKNDLTAEYVRARFDYDPLTGVMVYKEHPDLGSRIEKVGTEAGSVLESKGGYHYLTVGPRRYRRSRLAWLHYYGVWPEGQVDHKDTIRTHDWIENLRDSTQSNNQRNRSISKNNTVGLKGVFKRQRPGHKLRYIAQIWINGKRVHIGCFDTAEEAHKAYVDRAKAEFGEWFNAG